MAKHNPGMDLDNLDLKAVEKEMEAEEATAGNATNEGANDGGDNQTVWIFSEKVYYPFWGGGGGFLGLFWGLLNLLLNTL